MAGLSTRNMTDGAIGARKPVAKYVEQTLGGPIEPLTGWRGSSSRPADAQLFRFAQSGQKPVDHEKPKNR